MTAQTVFPPINRLLRRPLVEAATGDSRTTIYRKIQDGLFPSPVKIGGGRSAWPENEVEAVNKARIAGKPDNEIRAMVAKLHTARKELRS